MDYITPQRKIHWYQTVWGVGLIGLGVFVGAVIVLFSILTIKFVFDIRAGKGGEAGREFYGSFTPFTGLNSTSGSIDRARLEEGDFPYLGSSTAATTIVEFVDFKCPNCRTAHPIMQQVVQKHGSKVKLIIRELPFESLHPGTTDLAYVAVCSREQGKFWAVYDYFFVNQDRLPEKWSENDTVELARFLDMDSQKLLACIKKPATQQAVNRDYADAISSGARGTPTFFVNGRKLEGVVPLSVWEEILK